MNQKKNQLSLKKWCFMENELEEPAIAYGTHYTMNEFLQLTETSEFKFEYWNSEMLPVAATTQAHAEVAGNLTDIFKNKLKPMGCKSFQESVFLRIKNKNSLFLPDVLITCNLDDISPNSRFVDNPSIIIEILSESTELFDRSEKWNYYRQIPSLRYYLMVSQKEPMVEVYGRRHAQSLFYFQDFKGLDTIVVLSEMDLTIPMEEIYDGIVFETMAELS
jgi:Uma2 family endonuclease